MLLKNLNLLFIFLFTSTLFAQVKDLPYSATWEITDEQNEWTQYRLTPSTFFDWNFSTGAISHDYPVGNIQGDTIRDWMVSPIINFHSTSKLSFQGNVFSLIGITEVDYFGIWFSDGSKDPNDGDYVEILDLTGSTVGPNMIDTAGVEISFTTDEGYIAFVYEATNNWFTVGVDSVAIIPDFVPVKVVDTYLDDQINIFPNPTSDRFNLSISNTIALEGFELNVFNSLGQLVISQPINNHQTAIDCSLWMDGVYFYQVRMDGVLVKMEKVIIN
jgi:hypothetical protein